MFIHIGVSIHRPHSHNLKTVVRIFTPNLGSHISSGLYSTMYTKVQFVFYIHGSVHSNSKVIRSNNMEQYAGIYLLQNHSMCFRCPSHPSSGVHKTVTAASGTGHSIWVTTFLHRDLKVMEEGCYYDLYHSTLQIRRH
jgi:hypothetical protein